MKKFFVIAAMALLTIGSASAQKKVVEALQLEVATLKQEISALKGVVETLRSSVGSDKQAIQNLTTVNNETVAKVQSLTAQLEVAIKQNGNAATEIANLKAQVEALTKLLNEKMVEIEGQLATAAAKPAEPAKPQYEVVGKMHSGMVLVKEGLLYGYVNSKNEYIIPAKYEEAKDFKDGYAIVKKNDKWGIVDASGKETVSCSYDSCRHYHGTIWVVQKGDYYGLISATNGNLIQPIKYTRIGFRNLRGEYVDAFNRWQMCINGKYGCFNEKGQVVIPAKYNGEIRFMNGIANVEINGKQYTINTSGTIIKNGYTF